MDVISVDLSREKSLYTMQGLQEERNDPQLCDVVIVVGNQKIHAHRCVLAANSRYFRAMFTANLAERRQAEITLKDTDSKSVEQLVNFIYTGKISISSENVESLLCVADMLQIEDVLQECCNFLAASLNPTNCIGIYRFSDAHSLLDLTKTALRYIYQHFQDVSAGDEFLNLALDQLLELISSDDLEIRSEETIYEAVMSWLRNKNEACRLEHLETVMQSVRFCLLSTKFLVDTVNNETLIMENALCRQLVEKAKTYHLQSFINEQPADGPQTRTRRRQESVAVFGVDVPDEEAASSVERHAPVTWTWRLMTSMLERRSHNHATLGFCERYDPINGIWSSIASLKVRQARPSLTICNGLIYAVDGHNKDGQILRTVEVYNPDLNIWKNLPSAKDRPGSLIRTWVSCT